MITPEDIKTTVRAQAHPHFDFNQFDARVQALRAMFKYRRPTECPQENQQQQTTDTFSEMPMARTEREARLACQIQRPTLPTSRKEWVGSQSGGSIDESTALPPCSAHEQPASSSTEKGVV